jgi:hypothetical protein
LVAHCEAAVGLVCGGAEETGVAEFAPEVVGEGVGEVGGAGEVFGDLAFWMIRQCAFILYV